MVRPKYNSEIGEFLGLYETVGFLVVRGDAGDIFLNCGFDKEKSKVLYSQYRRKIPNASCGNMFNRHRMIESGELDSDISQLHVLLPSVTDKFEEINQYLKNISIAPIDIKQNQLNVWAQNGAFNPAKLDLYEDKKK